MLDVKRVRAFISDYRNKRVADERNFAEECELFTTIIQKLK